MPRLLHISATEVRHLCGLLTSGGRSSAAPFDAWLDRLSTHPDRVCADCRRAAMQSADRSRIILKQEALYGRHRDLFDKP
jgi:hypothetical protein